MYQIYWPSKELKRVAPPKIKTTQPLRVASGYSFNDQRFNDVVFNILNDREDKINESDYQLINKDGDTLLHIMVRRGKIERIEELLAKGIDPRKKNKKGLHAIDLAIQNNLDINLFEKHIK